MHRKPALGYREPLTVRRERDVARARRAALVALTILAGAGLAAPAAEAAAGDLDPSFGRNGIVVHEDGDVTEMAVAPDGKIVTIGVLSRRVARPDGEDVPDRDMLLARYNADGSVDRSFGTGGRVVQDFGGRYNPDGFRGGSDRPRGVAVQRDGRIVVVGGFDSESLDTGAIDYTFIARYLAGGRPDPNFGQGGRRVFEATNTGEGGEAARPFPDLVAVAVQPDGRIVAGGTFRSHTNCCVFGPDGSGSDFGLLRFTATGQEDPSFPLVRTDFDKAADILKAVRILPDGRIVAAGEKQGDDDTSPVAVARYDAQGALDPTFGNGGRALFDFADAGRGNTLRDIALTADGGVVLAGQAVRPDPPGGAEIGVARLTSAGALDPAFSGDGRQTYAYGQSTGPSGVALQADGRILVGAGVNASRGGDFGVLRLLPDGRPDPGFRRAGWAVDHWGLDQAWDIAVLADGRILSAGMSQFTLESDLPLAGRSVRGVAFLRHLPDGRTVSGPLYSGPTVTTSLGAGDVLITASTPKRCVPAGQRVRVGVKVRKRRPQQTSRGFRVRKIVQMRFLRGRRVLATDRKPAYQVVVPTTGFKPKSTHTLRVQVTMDVLYRSPQRTERIVRTLQRAFRIC